MAVPRQNEEPYDAGANLHVVMPMEGKFGVSEEIHSVVLVISVSEFISPYSS